jgi:hypothetical protein
MTLTDLKEYLKIHIVSLQQDTEKYGNYLDEDEALESSYLQGQIVASNHILELLA